MRNLRFILLISLIAIFVPWLGETLFNTKGEPREAIVAVSMLQSGDWVLPTSYGDEIPFKPPFLAWLIAIFSIIFNGGEVNEFTSRLPSAIAAISMIMAGYSWACKYAALSPLSQRIEKHTPRDNAGFVQLPWIMAAVTASSFEVFRAAVNCRVDMLLTSCIVIALYLMYEWRESKGQPLANAIRFIAIILLLSGAVLTKGPVGALLPCLCMGIYCLLRGDNFFKTLGWLLAVCILAMALPTIWYVKAYEIGGEEFKTLALEENIGRLTGTMTYEGHENPWYYNIFTILAGMLPWTLIALPLLGIVTYKIYKSDAQWLRVIVNRFKHISSPSLFALVVSVIVFIFYCIPDSKRSVYLLPMYPFMAYGVAVLLIDFYRSKALKSYCSFMISLAFALPIIAIAMQWIPLGIPVAEIHFWQYPLVFLPIATALFWYKNKKERLKHLTITTLTIVFAYISVVQPMILNAKTNLKAIAHVAEAQRNFGPIYSWSDSETTRYYTVNFYLNNSLRSINADKGIIPVEDSFCVLTSPQAHESLIDQFTGYQSQSDTIIAKSTDTRLPVILVKFHK